MTADDKKKGEEEGDGPRVPASVRQFLEGSADAAVVLTADREVVYHNTVYERFCGLRPRAIARAVSEGKRCHDIFPIEVCSSRCLLREAEKGNRAIRMDEIFAERADGKEIRLIVTNTPIEEGLFVEVYRDVTAEARMQASYKALLALEREAKVVLEQEVAARTDQLRHANEELKRAQAMLIHQETMSSLGRLVAGIAHELNNPINFIYGNIDFVEEYLDQLIRLTTLYDEVIGSDKAAHPRITKLKDEIEYDYLRDDAAKLISSIRHGAERTAAIVRDLRIFSRPDTSDMKSCDLVTGIESTLSLLNPLFKDRITVARDFEPIPRVFCHGGHINQVFMNILTNAAEAIDGEGEIVIRTRRTEKGVRITFRDSGPGISDENLPKLFEPFFTTKEVGEGTGLGLSICEGILRHHGGGIGVESGPDGSVFVVDLPLTPPAEVLDRPKPIV